MSQRMTGANFSGSLSTNHQTNIHGAASTIIPLNQNRKQSTSLPFDGFEPYTPQSLGVATDFDDFGNANMLI